MAQTSVGPSTGRGRHRRPRPRKVLFAVGGLALAAGALSLARMAPEAGIGGLGTTEAEPPHDPGSGAGRSDNTAVTVGAVPRVSPSATSVPGGVSATPTPTTHVVSLPAATTTAPPAATGPGTATTIPDTPDRSAPATTPLPTTATPQPAPTPTPSRTTEPPAPTPSEPGLCVPIIGLCVDSQRP